MVTVAAVRNQAKKWAIYVVPSSGDDLPGDSGADLLSAAMLGARRPPH